MSSQLIELGGSLLAVLALIGLCWLLGFRSLARLANEEEARELMRLAHGGFEPVSIALDGERRAAIGRNGEGEVLVLLPHGNQFVARHLSEGASLRAADGVLEISHEGHKAVLSLGDAAKLWAIADSSAS